MDYSAYLPVDLSKGAILAGGLASVVAAGFAISRVRVVVVARALARLLVAGSVVGAHVLTTGDPGGYRMIAIILALLFSMKCVVQVEVAATGGARLGVIPYTVFATCWFGMQPRTFTSFPGPARAGRAPLVRKALVALVTGAGCIVAAATLRDERALALVLLLPGLSLLLHFGLFNLIAAALRTFGADTYALFREPLRSTSLEAFWSRRWNRGFSEMTSLGIHRPLSRAIGSRASSVVAFLVSGLFHELAISVPVNAGYGLPLAYFGIHAALMQIESIPRVRRILDRRRAIGRAWVLTALVLPLPILFHRAFLSACVWPVIGGAPGD